MSFTALSSPVCTSVKTMHPRMRPERCYSLLSVSLQTAFLISFIPQRTFFFPQLSVSPRAWQIKIYAIHIQSLPALISELVCGPSTVCTRACSACLMRFGWPGRVYLWFTSYIRAGSCSWCRSSSTDERNPCQPHYPNLMNPHESFIRAELLETRRLKWRMCTYLFMSICPYLPLVISKARVPYGRAFCPNAVMQSRAHTSNRDVKNPLKLC